MRATALLLLLAVGCVAPARGGPLAGVAAWAIQLDGLDREGAIEALERAPGDLVVIEPMRSIRGHEDFATRDVVARLRAGRTCLAYLNVGQAESYRTYWPPYWLAPAAGTPGEPDYLLAPDPDGWADNHVVSFWDIRWRAVLWGSPRAPLDQILEDGFDGVYLDWVLGFRDPAVVAAAEADGVDPARAMAELVRDLRSYARRRNPRFLVVIQNPEDLAARVPDVYGWIDGVGQESVTFSGDAGVAWDDAAAGDHPVAPRPWDHLAEYVARGLPVLTIDYAADPDHARAARERSRGMGFVPFVTRTPLDRLP